MRSKPSSDDRTATIHALENVAGNSWMRLSEYIHPVLATPLSSGSATCRIRELREAQLLLLRLETPIQSQTSDPVALRRHVSDYTVQKVVEAVRCVLWLSKLADIWRCKLVMKLGEKEREFASPATEALDCHRLRSTFEISRERRVRLSS
jgi:hypothetical protein